MLAAVAEGRVVVQDIPLLVEGGMAAHFPLVVVVHADAAVRVRRLVEQRGMPESDARARIAAQADDAARRAVADVWLDNSGVPEALTAAVDALWHRRLAPFAAGLAADRPAPGPTAVVDPDPAWPAQAARLVARVEAAAGERGRGGAHVGPTAVPGLPAPDVIELLLGVSSPADAVALRGALAGMGFVTDRSGYASADPGRPARLRVHVVDSPGWRSALRLRDWLRADPRARAEYTRSGDPAALAAAAEAWAASSGWAPSLNGTKPDS
jgi:dephospho-CoA kinase